MLHRNREERLAFLEQLKADRQYGPDIGEPAVDSGSRTSSDNLTTPNVAMSLLRSTDHIEFRTPTPTRTPSVAWLAWREQLREVVRGNATEIPPEPERYNAP